MLVGSRVSGVGSRFWCRDEKSDGLVSVGRVADIKIIIFVMRDRFTIVTILPLLKIPYHLKMSGNMFFCVF